MGRPKRRLEDNIKVDLRDRWGELDSPGSGKGPVAGFCENGNEPSGSIKKQVFFDKLNVYQLSKNVLHHAVSK
jgi:hypothetical protein